MMTMHQYQSYQGFAELRQGMADFYENNYGVTLNSVTEILPLMGSKEVLCIFRWL
jgi:aspartate/methionine/tyrosine aminotransferase